MRDIDYGTFVRLIRAQRGQTQEEFARELEVTVGTINGWENGRHRPVRAQRTRLGRLAEELGVTPPTASTTGAAHIAGERDVESPKVGSADVPAPQKKVEPVE
jgi:transcriptional regulator with XRE-family HTH domain